MTNGDRIRQMSNEELAELLDKDCLHCLHFKERTCCGMREEGIKAYLDMEEE